MDYYISKESRESSSQRQTEKRLDSNSDIQKRFLPKGREFWITPDGISSDQYPPYRGESARHWQFRATALYGKDFMVGMIREVIAYGFISSPIWLPPIIQR